MKQNTLTNVYPCNSASTLLLVLKPVRILTRVVFCLPEWIDAKDQPMSVAEIIALSTSCLIAALDASLVTYGVYSFVDLIRRNATLMDIINPMLWVLWNTMPLFVHVFLLCNLSRLRDFFLFLKSFQSRHALLNRYRIKSHRTIVTVAYGIHLALQVTSGVGLMVFMHEHPQTPPLLTSIAAFNESSPRYFAYVVHAYNGMYVAAGVVATDLGVGFIFYYLSLSFRSLTLFTEDCSAEVVDNMPGRWHGPTSKPQEGHKHGARPTGYYMAELWETYEDILKSIEKANTLLGPLVLANQLNHLTGAAVFTYSGMRSVFLFTAQSVTVYIVNWTLFYFRSIVFVLLVTQVNSEHQNLQNSLARLSATYSKLDLQGDAERRREFSTVKALLNRVQNHVVAVSPLGLYSVTPGTLCAMAGTVTAYLVVLLQTKSS